MYTIYLPSNDPGGVIAADLRTLISTNPKRRGSTSLEQRRRRIWRLLLPARNGSCFKAGNTGVGPEEHSVEVTGCS